MAAPRDEVGSGALERPPRAWTMLGWGAGPREAHSAMTSAWKTSPAAAGLWPVWPEGGSQALVPKRWPHFHPEKDRISVVGSTAQTD